MLNLTLLAAALLALNAPSRPISPETARWEAQAKKITIIRDDWGIAHVYGKTDADVVFGAMYAQSEDDFNRVETNFINSMGRLAEAEGAAEIYRDLRMKIFIDPDTLKAKYKTSPAFLKTLMVAWADGLNFYLYKHPDVKPRVITHFEPWMALSFSEGSIGGDIEKVSLRDLEAFYGKAPTKPAALPEGGAPKEPSGSNGFAIAPQNTLNHHALLWINPHTSFFFRSELQMVSEEGLNAYGASTWGQFFIYQGFNDKAGWMHTTSNVDDIDEYLETVTKRGDGYVYTYGAKELPLTAMKITVPYKTGTGMTSKEFTVYRTQHGPVIREQDGKWVAVRMMQEPVKALTQSFTRTKARNYKEFRKTMDLHTNSSNNTIFADASGNIAYFHGNFIPRRDTSFDWTKPVDGSNPATQWKGLHTVEESPHLLNPKSGWLYNTNNWPFSAAGESSPKKENYPAYMETGGENPRGIHAIRVLSGVRDFTPNTLIRAAFDSYLPTFAQLVPTLVAAYDQAPAGPAKTKVAEQVALLRTWNYRWDITSVPTTLGVYWVEELQRMVGGDARRARINVDDFMEKKTTADQRLQALAAASDKLAADFGTWKTPWGDINRFQRLTGDIVQPFSDAGASIPVGFTSSRFGSLASFGARAYKGTRKMYGTSGNSFLAVVEFGDSVRAKAISAGGESGDPKSKHFDDQAVRYSTGELRDVYFYRPQLKGHTERQYHPGE
ncbi:MAG: peptidase penicillin amidase [Gemmatimonadetes bacterium]|nr:peptidase penicillin amidase [Gemmatimonadota bacterium]